VAYFKQITGCVNVILSEPLSRCAGGWHNTAT